MAISKRCVRRESHTVLIKSCLSNSTSFSVDLIHMWVKSHRPDTIVPACGCETTTTKVTACIHTCHPLFATGPCPQFQCEGGFNCDLERLGGICEQLPRYCIYDDQRCNGIANCGEHDDSDERRCKHGVHVEGREREREREGEGMEREKEGLGGGREGEGGGGRE